MERQTFNKSGGPTVLVVLGLGNRLDGECERWLVDRLTDADYRVHAVELPTEIASFDRQYRIPVQRVADEQQPDAVLSHSLGGLVAAYLETDARAVYLAPWWGIYEGKVSVWERWLVPRLPTSRPILPTKTGCDELGEHLSEEGWAAVPERVSPMFITAVYRAQQARPSIDDDAVVFVSPTDTVVSIRAIGEAVAADRIHLYDGGHQLFSSAGRRRAVEAVLAALSS